jgi:hypothetical protein
MSNADTSQKLIFIRPTSEQKVVFQYKKRLRQPIEDDKKTGHGRVRRRWLVLTTALCSALSIALVICFVRHENLKRSYHNERQSVTNKVDILNTQQHVTKAAMLDLLNSSRLPHDVKPTHYKLNLRIDVNQLEFHGSCEITVKCYQATEYVFLHSEATLKHEYGPIVMDSLQNKLAVRNVHINNMYSYLIIELAQKLSVGNTYTIVFKQYHAPILNDLKGLYASSYKLTNGTIR